jgi:hypothetical protein
VSVSDRDSPLITVRSGTPRARHRGRQMLPLAREPLNAALHGGATAQASASRSHLFGQMCEIHGEDMHIVGRKLGEAYVPVEPGCPLVAMPDVQMQSM